MGITDIRELMPYFPPGSVIQTSTLQWNSPSPIKREGDFNPSFNYNGVDFYGEDRLVWLLAENKFFLRGSRVYSISQVLDQLNLDLPEGVVLPRIDYSPVKQEIKKPTLRKRRQILRFHAAIDRDYWVNRGIQEDTIERFFLGYGAPHPSMTPSHTIAIDNLVNLETGESYEGYYVFFKNPEGGGWLNSKGSKKNQIQLIADDPDTNIVAITEGARDCINAWQAGFKNVAIYEGSGGFSQGHLEYLKDCGYTTVIDLMDRDNNGRKYSQNIISWAKIAGLSVKSLNWNSVSTVLGDFSDICEHLNGNLSEFLDENILEVEDTQIVLDVETTTELSSLDILRGEGEGSIRKVVDTYIEGYKEAPSNTTLLVSPPPGAGKTHTLIQVAEDFARDNRQLKLVELAQINQNILEVEEEILEAINSENSEEIGRLTRRKRRFEYSRDNFMKSTVAWFGQYRAGWDDLISTGADPNMWYNFEARNGFNCENFALASELGSKGHDVNGYCQTTCPFREKCRESGYQKQYEEMKEKDIVFFRHPSLIKSGIKDGFELYIVDENPNSQIDGNLQHAVGKDLLPTREGWDLNIEDRVQIRLANILISALRQVLAISKADNLYMEGLELFTTWDSRIRDISNEEFTLESILEMLSPKIFEQYQPQYSDSDTMIVLRCVEDIFKQCKREVDTFGLDEEFNSVFTLQGGKLEYSSLELPKLPKTKPLVVLDATPMPMLYEYMFSRDLRMFNPSIKNENASTIVLTGMDVAKQTRDQNTEDGVSKRRAKLAELKKENPDFSTYELPLDKIMYENPLSSRLLSYIQNLHNKHKSLLIVTFKDWAEILSTAIINNNVPFSYNPKHKLEFGSYGALRGTNKYKDFEAVFLIGAWRIPYNVVRQRARIWLSLAGIRELVPHETVELHSKYHNTNTLGKFRSYTHPFAAEYVKLIEVAEVQQCAARIRAHSTNEKKYIYMMANRPFLNHTTEVKGGRAYFNTKTTDSKYGKVKEFIVNYHTENGVYPKYREVLDNIKTSNSTIRAVLDELKA